MSCINNYYKDFECDEHTTDLVNRILQEYKPLLRWIRNRQNKWGDEFKLDLYQYTLYNLCVNTWNRLHKHNMSDEEILKYAPMSIYRSYADSVKNMPVNIRELREYPYYVTDESDSDTPGTVLSPLQEDENLNRAGSKTLEELIESLPCDDSLKTAIFMMSQGFKQCEAAEAIGIKKNTLSMKLKALRESDKFRDWVKLNGMNL